MSLKIKVLLLSIGLSLVAACVGLSNFVVNGSIQEKYQGIVLEEIPKLQAISDMYIAYQQIRIAVRTLGLPDLTAEQAKAAVEATKKAIESYEEKRAAYSAYPPVGDEIALRNKNEQSWEKFKAIAVEGLRIEATGSADRGAQLRNVFLTSCPEAAAEYLSSVIALKEYHQDSIRAEALAALKTRQTGQMISITIIVLGVLGGSAIGSFMAYRISKRLAAISDEMENNSSVVLNMAGELKESSSHLTESSQIQASAIQQTASSVEEIRAMVARNYDGSLKSNELSRLSQSHAQQGHQSVTAMIQAMDEIQRFNEEVKAQMEASNQKMSDVISVIQEIGSKTTVINDIVFQTKLLSFNASVEAARAGEHGKGFAVVAEEVGHLASMSGKAAEEIRGLLDSSRERVETLAKEAESTLHELMSKSNQKVEYGAQTAKACGGVLDKIVENAQSLSEITQSISQASKEQSVGVDEIAKAVQELDQTLQTNHNETTKTSTSALELNQQVISLQQSTHRLDVMIKGKRAA